MVSKKPRERLRVREEHPGRALVSFCQPKPFEDLNVLCLKRCPQDAMGACGAAEVALTPEEADRLVEGDRVRMRGASGTVVGTTANCVSIQWDGRETPEIYTVDDMRPISRARAQK
jgi:hypothetical protein